ncbi:MAG: hypothetical protein ACREFR_08910 [Limisphaerales bacterium]
MRIEQKNGDYLLEKLVNFCLCVQQFVGCGEADAAQQTATDNEQTILDEAEAVDIYRKTHHRGHVTDRVYPGIPTQQKNFKTRKILLFKIGRIFPAGQQIQHWHNPLQKNDRQQKPPTPLVNTDRQQDEQAKWHETKAKVQIFPGEISRALDLI